ncbi:hypothetical protein MUN78_16410 [Leucobacter allii]|uniref:HNH endonuclease n=1 Tax=Leucobacter allii TaxID=2932247 RepID=A0ABY4FLQ4_9MICO|nr:hypothetical protein [Leucobacter allii]UOQ57213.1 hypothetical protein MUN78_16410 [Leucobacter allii]
MPKKTTAAVLERDGGLCVLRLDGCLVEASCADHRANRGHGGARSGVLDRLSNLLAACGLCNGHKEDAEGDLRADLERRGVRLRSDSTHAKTALRALVTPVIYPDGGRYYLDDFGGREEVKEQPF